MSPPACIPDEEDPLSFVRKYWPNATDAECESLLWESTCYPFGSLDKVAAQLADSYVATGGNVTKAIDDAYAEIDRIMSEYNKLDHGDIL